MKKFVLTLLLWLISLSFCNADLAWYTIDKYDADFTLTKNWVLEVVENINVNFYEHRHGIYRKMPYIYQDYLKTPIKKVRVPWYMFSKDTELYDFIIKIGDPNRMVVGNQNYVIKYNVKWTVWNFKEYQEIWRNMLWNDINTSVNNYKFSFTLPTDLDLSDDDIQVYVWPYWSTDTIEAIKSGNVISIPEPLNLWPHESVTLVVKLPANYVPTRKYISLYWWTIYYRRSIKFTIWCLILCVIWFYTIRCWRKANKQRKNFKKKKDELMQTHWKKIRDVIHFSFPKWYTAAEIASIYNWKSNFESLSAFLFSRIEDGYVSLETNSKKFLGFKSKEYEFKTNTSTPKFKFDESRKIWDYLIFQNPEEQFWNLCFVKWDINNLSSFSESQSNLLKKIADEIFYSVHSKLIPQYGEFNSISYSLLDKYKISSARLNRKQLTNTQRKFYWLVSAFLCWIGLLFVLLKFNINMSDSVIVIIFGFGLSCMLLYNLIIWIIKTVLKRKEKSWFKNVWEDEKYVTEEWIDAIEQTFWFRKYLLTVDDKKLQTLLSEDPAYFEKVLPYAIALGVWNHWIKKCMKYLNEIQDIKDTDRYDAIASKTNFSESISNTIYKIDHPRNSGSSSSWRSSSSSGWWSWHSASTGWWWSWGWWGWWGIWSW